MIFKFDFSISILIELFEERASLIKVLF